MRRLVINGLAAATIVGTPLVGHTVWTAMSDGASGKAYASQDLGDDLLRAMDARQVTPRATPTAAPRPPASPTVSGAGAQTGKGAPAQAPKGGAAPAQAPKGGAAPAQGPKAGAAPAQAPRGGAAPSALPRTGELPIVGGLALAATALVGAGFAFRRFRR